MRFYVCRRNNILMTNVVPFKKIDTLRVHVSAKKRYATRTGSCAQHKYVVE